MGNRIEAIMRTAIGSVSFTHAEDTNTTVDPHVNGSNYLQKYSQSQHTITQYKGDYGVDTKVYPKSGIKYPYDKVINFFSNFSSGFRVCFVCGKEDHYRRSNSPQGTRSRDYYEKNQRFPFEPMDS